MQHNVQINLKGVCVARHALYRQKTERHLLHFLNRYQGVGSPPRTNVKISLWYDLRNRGQQL